MIGLLCSRRRNKLAEKETQGTGEIASSEGIDGKARRAINIRSVCWSQKMNGSGLLEFFWLSKELPFYPGQYCHLALKAPRSHRLRIKIG